MGTERGGRTGQRRTLLCGALLCGVLLAAGCTGHDDRPAPRSSSPTASPASPTLSAERDGRTGSPDRGVSAAGCAGGGPALREGRGTIRYGGLERVYLLALPRGRGPHPVLFDLHGLGSNAADQAAYSRLPRRGAERGYIGITPQAAQGRLGWTLPHAYGPDDTGFLGALLERVERGACVDRGRVFAAGMSFGAGMSTALICATDNTTGSTTSGATGSTTGDPVAGRLAGVAAVAGLNIVPPCENPAPVTLLAFHGTADTIVPYRGGHPFQNSHRRRALARLVTLPPVEQSARAWAKALGCGAQDDVSAPAGTVRLDRWTGCRGGASVRLYTLRGAGHTWPGAIGVPRLGPTGRDLDATEVILDAFDATPPR
ncbi:alpha/beta hydrolase family esterase [Nonomuraea roseoviolacea]|uniref:Polyhydroxybutyrate depolymerase n=1 Tax=Nonomuraea roseoviolacea subsp. carminata TaxID=160689 RepID=A0ABT1KGC8_9ACTN|nr:hypothetical protein [Nonomuraea roseoviolacea]MCP2352024.1 polyhydroxybutyrate depolymerase [Nonomuraea roseoviolacea subsp. carminata]